MEGLDCGATPADRAAYFDFPGYATDDMQRTYMRPNTRGRLVHLFALNPACYRGKGGQASGSEIQSTHLAGALDETVNSGGGGGGASYEVHPTWFLSLLLCFLHSQPGRQVSALKARVVACNSSVELPDATSNCLGWVRNDLRLPLGRLDWNQPSLEPTAG